MDVANLFSISPEVPAPNRSSPEWAQLVVAFLPVKTWNVERVHHVYRPGTVLADIPDNADIAGPDSIYDYYA